MTGAGEAVRRGDLEATTAASELEPLAEALVGAGESLADWWVDHPDRPATAMAMRLMNLVWMGFGSLSQGRVWSPPAVPASP